MLEASFIAPVMTNDGADTTSAQWQAELALLETFGGFTREAGLHGVWRDPATGRTYEDDSARYLVAADWTDATRDQLRRIAGEFAFNASQEAVYLKLDSGAVELVAPHATAAKAAKLAA